MKKVDISFACDRCTAPLPKQFEGTNQNGDKYYDLRRYNSIQIGRGVTIRFDIDIDIEYNKTQRELCPKCRVDTLRDILRRLESEQKEA